MLKKLLFDAFGISDIGKILDKSEFPSSDTMDYLLNEDEEILFLIKTKKDEYSFTNLAFIHLDGTKAVSSKRVLKRYEYLHHSISDVLLETAGNIELTVDVKFKMGDYVFQLDVKRKQLDELKRLYKALSSIALIQEENSKKLAYAKEAQNLASQSLKPNSYEPGANNSADTFEAIRQSSMNFMMENHERYIQKDFSDVFAQYFETKER